MKHNGSVYVPLLSLVKKPWCSTRRDAGDASSLVRARSVLAHFLSFQMPLEAACEGYLKNKLHVKVLSKW
jgi:hypothetical protein